MGTRKVSEWREDHLLAREPGASPAIDRAPGPKKLTILRVRETSHCNNDRDFTVHNSALRMLITSTNTPAQLLYLRIKTVQII